MPTAWKRWFHSVGIQTSNVMLESADGRIVPATRQKLGRSAPPRPPRAPARPIADMGPGATTWAVVIVVSASVRPVSPAQASAVDAAPGAVVCATTARLASDHGTAAAATATIAIKADLAMRCLLRLRVNG